MNERWNLNPIYRGFDDPCFEADLQALKAQVAACDAFAQELAALEPAEGLRRGIALLEATTELAYKLGGYASLRQAADTRDPEAGSQMGRIMSVLSGTAGPEAAFKDWAARLPNLMELVRADESLKDYEFLFSDIASGSR